MERAPMSKDTIRQRSFSRKNIATKVVTVVMDGSPTEIEIVQPTEAQRRALIETGRLGADGQPKDLVSALAMKRKAVVLCARDPETHEQIWEDRDGGQFDAQPAGGWLDEIGDHCIAMMRPQSSVEEQAKNSGPTTSAT
jgi:hypothetical protein